LEVALSRKPKTNASRDAWTERKKHIALTCRTANGTRTLDNADASRPDDRIGYVEAVETVRQTLKKNERLALVE